MSRPLNDAPKTVQCVTCTIRHGCPAGLRHRYPLCRCGTYLRSPLSQVGLPLSFAESVSFLHILSLINQHFVKGLFLLPTVASPGPCHRGEELELSCCWERLYEGWRHSKSWKILNRVRGLELVEAVIRGFKYVYMGVRCPRQ